jgi:hypothetical protein
MADLTAESKAGKKADLKAGHLAASSVEYWVAHSAEQKVGY